MSIKEFEELLKWARSEFRNALKSSHDVNDAKVISRMALRRCCSEFEEKTMCENLREVLVEEYGLV